MPAEEQTALWKSKEDVYRRISTKMTPLPGLTDFLERCREANLAMILVTNAPRVDAVHTLRVLDLYHRRVGREVLFEDIERSIYQKHTRNKYKVVARRGPQNFCVHMLLQTSTANQATLFNPFVTGF